MKTKSEMVAGKPTTLQSNAKQKKMRTDYARTQKHTIGSDG